MDLRRALKDEPLPAVAVDLDAFDRNVRHAAGLLQHEGHTLRLATKSVRVSALIRRVLDHGAPYSGLMCFSAREAGALAAEGFDDLLVAYPTVAGDELRVLRDAHESGTDVKLMVDGLEQLVAASREMAGVGHPFPVVLDVDMSLRAGGLHMGVRRSPLRTNADVLRLLEQASELPHVTPVGLMGYEAQVAGLGDRNPFKPWSNPVFKMVRGRSVKAVARRRAELAEAARDAGHVLDLFNGGGTGSLDTTAREPHLTELTVGSGLLCSHLFDYYSNVQFEPACFFALQVVRSSDPGYVTCLGGGYVASGEPGWDKVPVPHDPPGLRLVTAEGCGEVQTPLRVPPGVDLEIGDAVLFRHAKAGELAERFERYALVSGGEIVDRVPTYRGQGWCFL
jgi:D-serine deaminase-like pyridoxal phosphate-dependent protein